MNSEKTLIILNPTAGSGRAGKIWAEIEPLLWKELGELVVAVTQKPEDVAEHLDKARDAGLTRVVAIGGDGTNHAIINAIQELQNRDPQAPVMTFAQLPVGTGRDFARTLGTPFDAKEAVQWIAHSTPKAIDLGHLEYNNKNRYFLNIASAGITGDIANRVNLLTKRRPTTFITSTLISLMRYKAPKLKIRLDGEDWYDDKAWAVVVANGRMFGHGMLVAPDAEIDDGKFDVLVFEGIPRLKAMIAFQSIFGGAHIKRKDVQFRKASEVIVDCANGDLMMELDGESTKGQHLKFSVKHHALQMLVGS